MNLYKSLSLFLVASSLALAACGSDTEGGAGGNGAGGDGAGGDGAGGSGTGGSGTGGAGGGTTDPNLCLGVPSPVICTDGSCPAGYVCTKDVDPNMCHPSSCSCDSKQGWACTADCGMNGSTCTK